MIMNNYELENTFVFTVTDESNGKRADAVCAEACASSGLTLTRSAVQKLIDGGAVTKEGSPIAKNLKLKSGDVITVTLPEIEPSEVLPEDIPLDVVYEDGDIIVINKPQGMVVHPAPGHTTGTLVSALLYRCGDSLSGIGGVMRPGIVHRIDRDTSGLICVAKNDTSHLCLSEQLQDHSMCRTYDAVCIGRLKETKGRIEAPIGRSRTDRKKMAVVSDGKHAATNYEVMGEYSTGGITASHVRLKLETGRTHQIRVHMAYIGHPLLGDSVYGGGGTQFEKKHAACFEGQSLHASCLELTHPRTGERMTFTCPLPENFTRLLELLKG